MSSRWLLLLILLLAPIAEAQTKRAFIVGVAEYDELTDLQKTIGDARGYRGFFEDDLGYTTTFLTDPNETQFLDAFDAFKQSIAPGDEVVFIFSGHGWSDGAENYLALTDAPRNASESTIKRSTVPLARMVLADIEARQPSLVFAVIDACRDNPFDTLARDFGRGLVPVQQRKGTLVLFAAGAREKALDRLSSGDDASPYSVFTRVLLPKLRETDRPLVDIVDETRDEVERLARTIDHPQRPAAYSDVSRSFCFAGVCRSVSDVNVELAAFGQIRDCAGARGFLELYPNSAYRLQVESMAIGFCETSTTDTPQMRSLETKVDSFELAKEFHRGDINVGDVQLLSLGSAVVIRNDGDQHYEIYDSAGQIRTKKILERYRGIVGQHRGYFPVHCFDYVEKSRYTAVASLDLFFGYQIGLTEYGSPIKNIVQYKDRENTTSDGCRIFSDGDKAVLFVRERGNQNTDVYRKSGTKLIKFASIDAAATLLSKSDSLAYHGAALEWNDKVYVSEKPWKEDGSLIEIDYDGTVRKLVKNELGLKQRVILKNTSLNYDEDDPVLYFIDFYFDGSANLNAYYPNLNKILVEGISLGGGVINSDDVIYSGVFHNVGLILISREKSGVIMLTTVDVGELDKRAANNQRADSESDQKPQVSRYEILQFPSIEIVGHYQNFDSIHLLGIQDELNGKSSIVHVYIERPD